MTNIKTLLVRTKNIRKFNNQILAILLYCIFGIGSATAMSPPPPEPSPEPWFPQVDFVPGIPSLSLNFIGDEIRLTWNATEHAEYYPVYVYYDNQWRHLEDSHGTQVDYNDQQRGWNPNELQFKILACKAKPWWLWLAWWESDRCSGWSNIKNISNDSRDFDGDRVLNYEDAFPNDPSEIYDSNGDGVGNYREIDEDGDGVLDFEDSYPFDDSRTEITVFVETEFNDNISDADVVDASMPFQIEGVIQQSTDTDVFSFEVLKAGSITLLLQKTSESFLPSLTVVNSAGQTMPNLQHKFSWFTSNEDYSYMAISTNIVQAGTYYAHVTDHNARGEVTFAYGLTVFEDSDLDAISDDNEIALGSISRSNDSDGDDIIDNIEMLLLVQNGFNTDIDGDGIPNWLDRESDGDLIPDSIEGADDGDGDGFPNFLDSDSDGNGISDSTEAGSNPAQPTDTDRDGHYDFIDLDDDNDGLEDSIDSERTVSIGYSDVLDVNQRIMLQSLLYEDQALNLAVAGKTAVIKGLGFSSTANENLVIIRRNGDWYRNGDEYVSVTPTAATSTSLTFTMPMGVSTELFVIKNNLRSESLLFDSLHWWQPLIFKPDFLSVAPGSTVTLQGQNFLSGMVINAAGVSISPTLISDTELSFVVPTNAQSGDWYGITSGGESNKINLSVTNTSNTQVSVPAGYPIALDSLYIVNDYFQEYAVDSSGLSSVDISSSALGYLDVVAEDTAGEFITLQAVTHPDQDSLQINAASTALALVIQSLSDFRRLPLAQQISFMTAVSELSEVQAVANLIDNNIVSNPRYIFSQNEDLIRAEFVASNAARAILEPLVSSLTNDQTNIISLASAIKDPVITPEQQDIKVNSKKIGNDHTGDVEVENDTKLFLSTRIIEKGTNNELFPHISGYFDANVIGPQHGLLYWATTKDDFNQCNFMDCQVQVITPGINSIGTNSTVTNYLAARTLIEGIIYPIFKDAVEVRMSPQLFMNIIINAAPSLINEAVRKVAYGDSSGAVKLILSQLFADLTNAGPISQELGSKVAGSKVAKAVRKKIALRFVPVLNKILLLTDAFDIISLGFGIGVTLKDINSTHNNINFDVDWQLQIADFAPKTVSIDNGPVDIYFLGMSFNDAQGMLLVDTGKANSSIQVPVQALNSNYTYASITLPADWLDSQPVGPVELIPIDSHGVQQEKANDTLTLTRGIYPNIDYIFPSRATQGDQVCLYGTGFSMLPIENRVVFSSSNSDGMVSAIPLAVHKLSAAPSDYKLCVFVPLTTITGDVFVEVRGEESNKVRLEILSSDVSINFGDNGSLNDDTYALYVNGNLIHTMPSPTRSAGPFNLALYLGRHYVSLRGVTAPDDIGTYFISFSGNVSVLSGPALSGSDLTAGVQKNWVVEVFASTNSSTLREMDDTKQSIPIIWQE